MSSLYGQPQVLPSATASTLCHIRSYTSPCRRLPYQRRKFGRFRSRSRSFSLPAASTLLTGVLGHSWSETFRWRWYPRSHWNSSFMAKFSSTVIHVCTLLYVSHRQRFYYRAMKLSITTLELELLPSNVRESAKKGKSLLITENLLY